MLPKHGWTDRSSRLDLRWRLFMTRFVLISNIHLMNHPDELTEEQLRKQWYPIVMMKRWVPVWLVRLVVRLLRHTSLRAIAKLQRVYPSLQSDGLITLGDQIHGIAERGAEGKAGRSVLGEFLRLCQTMGQTLFHVPSEHPLGYRDGVDYFFRPRWGNDLSKILIEITRDIGGDLSEEAMRNWLELAGPLWGMKEVGALRFVWIDCDLFRWKRQIKDSNSAFLQDLLRRQNDFITETLARSGPKQVVLFTHRMNVISEERISDYSGRIKAVVFGDFHAKLKADQELAKFGPVPYEMMFVPAVWGVQFGVGHPGYAILEVEGSDLSFMTKRL